MEIVLLIACIVAVLLYSQTHAAKDAPDFNRGRNWRTAWGK